MVGLQVIQAGLDEDGGVVADDGGRAGRLGAGQDDAGQSKGHHVFPAPKRFGGFTRRGAGAGGFSGGCGLHFLQVKGACPARVS